MAELVVALDFSTTEEAIVLARQLTSHVQWVKVGFELYISGGPNVIRQLKDLDFKILLDLKLHDIPNTVAGAVRAASSLGIDLLTVHTVGGSAMLTAARKVAWDMSDHSSQSLRLLGVTILTSLTPIDVGLLTGQTRSNNELLIEPDLTGLTQTLAWEAYCHGLDGAVCSVWEVAQIKAVCGRDFLCLTPGIRPEGAAQDDQARVATPAIAVALGSDFLVVGRPIARAVSPLNAVARILEDMASVEYGPNY
ncbi:Orotidine 5'-phosphate decarboxylase [Desulfovibrionales bacterium]